MNDNAPSPGATPNTDAPANTQSQESGASGFYSQNTPQTPQEFRVAPAPWGSIDGNWNIQGDQGERPWYHAIEDPATRN